MRDSVLGDGDNVARYCGARALTGNKPMRTAFQPSKGYSRSVNWVEYFREPEIVDALKKNSWRSERNSYREKSGRFAVIGVRKIRQVGDRTGFVLHVRRQPDAGNESHAGIFGYAVDDKMVAIDLAYSVRRQDVFVPQV